MSTLLGVPNAMIVGIGILSVAVLIGTYLLLTPSPVRLPLERRRPVVTRTSRFAGMVGGATALIDRALRRRADADVHVAVLERAGVKIPLQSFALMLMAGTVVASFTGSVLGGPVAGVGLLLAVPLLARVVLGVLATRRQRAFAEQLDDTLQLMASSLRAGHSLLQALASVSREAEEPTSVEFAQIINEARVGRELGVALSETAARMGSDDFVWVTQAIAINREVGGNLAEVLDGVGRTIRERNQIRRQVQSLSAEGQLSAYVLIALPFGITGFLAVANPAYLAKFTQSLTGYSLIVAAVVLLIIGSVWLRKVTSFKF